MFSDRFRDSNNGNCIDSRQFVWGYLFKRRNLTISSRSQKQKSVSTPTTEAEYVGFSQAAKHFLWLKTALKDDRFRKILITLFCDNCSAIDLPENHRISKLSKYMDIHHHSVRELVYDKTLPLMYIWITDNVVDMYTKGLPEVQLSKLCAIALGYSKGGC
jgi:hypothetical protein